MKKRILSLILALVLALSVLPVVSAEEAAPAIDEAVLRSALEFAQAHPERMHELTVTEADAGTPLPATRQQLEDNFVAPGPLMEGCAAVKGDRMTLPLIRYQTGKPNQAQIILIFKGEEAYGDPVETLYGNFPLKEGIFEGEGIWNTGNASCGTYTVITCTASVNGNQYELIEDTASGEHVYVLDHYVPVTSYYFADENGKRLNKLVTDGSDWSYVYVKHEPAIATGIEQIGFSRTIGVFSEYSGLIMGYPTVYGWGELYIEPGTSSLGNFHLDVEVCVNKDGHHAEQTLLRNPAEYATGATMQYCPDCFTAKIVESPRTSTVFNKIHDVPQSQWYYDSVRGAVLRGLFNGVSENRFNPDGTMTRAMLVTVLWRYAGSPKEGKNAFSDVAAGQWYTDAVAWAAHHHIVDGVGGGRFAPNDTITREQMAAILYRYAGTIGQDTSARAELGDFADQSAVSAWASDPICWCVAKGYIGGTTAGDKLLLDPQGSATRAQVAAILMRFLKNVDPSMKYEPLDTTGAEESGTYTPYGSDEATIEWAFFPDGTLVFGKDGGRIPAGGTGVGWVQPERYDMPWDAYIERTTTIKVLGGVNEIGSAAFLDYPNLETVILPDSLDFIGEMAFMNCTSLKHIRWPEYSFSIGREAFRGCTALEEVVLPEGLNKVTAGFTDCTGLKKIVFPDSLITNSLSSNDMGRALDGCTALTEVRLPAGMTRIQRQLFRNCKSLETFVFPKGLSYIETSAFEGCESLKTLTLPMQVYAMSDRAFCDEFDYEEASDTCGLADLYILNPLFEVKTGSRDEYGNPYYEAPFGNLSKVTVHGWSGTFVEELALKMGYTFIPFEE